MGRDSDSGSANIAEAAMGRCSGCNATLQLGEVFLEFRAVSPYYNSSYLRQFWELDSDICWVKIYDSMPKPKKLFSGRFWLVSFRLPCLLPVYNRRTRSSVSFES